GEFAMKKQSNHSQILILAIFFVASSLASGCGFFKKQSRRTISTTHWGAAQDARVGAAKTAPTPTPAASTDETGAPSEAPGDAATDPKAADTKSADESADANMVADTPEQQQKAEAQVGAQSVAGA